MKRLLNYLSNLILPQQEIDMAVAEAFAETFSEPYRGLSISKLSDILDEMGLRRKLNMILDEL